METNHKLDTSMLIVGMDDSVHALKIDRVDKQKKLADFYIYIWKEK